MIKNNTMNNETFLPESYSVPDNSGYMRLKAGENTFRVLSSAITGFEFWNNNNKPVRSKDPFKTTPNIKVDKDGKSSIKHFWAFVVFNYESQAIQILELTQKSVQNSIMAIVKNKKWGDPKGYDITISRVGDGLDTEYTIMPNPHSEMPNDIIAEYESRNIDLTALYDGGDPFNATNSHLTPQNTASEAVEPKTSKEMTAYMMMGMDKKGTDEEIDVSQIPFG